MALKIIRNDITKMQVDAIVNTANENPIVGDGCDTAVYNAAGKENLLALRKQIGHINEGDAAITPGLALPAKYIIHAVSPLYIEDDAEVEGRLRNCYRNSFKLALGNDIHSIAFPLIATGSYGYPKEEGMRVAVDEINGFLLQHDMEVYLVVFSGETAELARRIDPELKTYIDENYLKRCVEDEYAYSSESVKPRWHEAKSSAKAMEPEFIEEDGCFEAAPQVLGSPIAQKSVCMDAAISKEFDEEEDGKSLSEHIKHVSDTFSEYLMYLIESKGLKNADVYKKSLVDKKIFSKIKNDAEYKPSKLTALCLCIGAQLNIDQAKDLLARAGYALSPANKTDIIFSYFIENGIYDIIELDIQLEEYGEKCIIS